MIQLRDDISDSEALNQIAGILGLYTTDPENNPAEEVLTRSTN